METDASTTWSQFQIVEPAISRTGDWDALQVELFGRTYLSLSRFAKRRSWHLKFTTSEREHRQTVDFLRVDTAGAEADELCASLDAELPWDLRWEEWQPLTSYRRTARDFTPAQVVDDLGLAHLWSEGWARYMSREGVTDESIRQLHGQINAFLGSGQLKPFTNALLAVDFPDARRFAAAAHRSMVAMNCFENPNAAQGTVAWGRRHLRANTVFSSPL